LGERIAQVGILTHLSKAAVQSLGVTVHLDAQFEEFAHGCPSG
jgi:hypothetical protein